MTRIDIISAVPELLTGPFDHSIVKRAIANGLVEIVVHNLRHYSTNKHRKIDDYPFGGGAGMVLMIEPIDRCVAHLRKQREYDACIYMSPDGEVLNQGIANELSMSKNLILLCGHYKGIDERVREHLVTREISIGDYVLSGGELAAAVVVDAVVRLIPGAISDESSALTDSFQDGLLDSPAYTRPADYKGMKVPDILLSGHEAKIATWRHEKALEKTQMRRPDLLDD